MSNRLESLEITNNSLFKGTIFCNHIESKSITNTDFIITGDLSITENMILGLDNGIEIHAGGNDNVVIASGNTNINDNAGNIELNVATSTLGQNGTLKFNVGGVEYQWPSTQPTANGQMLKVLSGGGSNTIVLYWD